MKVFLFTIFVLIQLNIGGVIGGMYDSVAFPDVLYQAFVSPLLFMERVNYDHSFTLDVVSGLPDWISRVEEIPPRLINNDTVGFKEEIGGAYVKEDILVVGTYDEMTIFDVSDPHVPVFLNKLFPKEDFDSVNEWYEFSGPKSVFIDSDDFGYFYCETDNSDDNDADLFIYDLHDPMNPTPISKTEGLGESCFGLDVGKDYLYSCRDGSTDFQIFDITDRYSVIPKGYISLEFEDFAHVGSYGYGINQEHIHVVDLSDPDSPSILNSTTLGSMDEMNFICIRDGDYAYISFEYDGELSSGMYVVNITERVKPEICGMLFGFGDEGGPVVVNEAETIAYVGIRDGFAIIDISIPCDPQLLSTFEDGGFRFSYVNTPYLTVDEEREVVYMYEEGGVEVVDVENAEDPVLIDFIDLQFHFYCMLIRDDIMYYGAHYMSEVRIIDVSDPNDFVYLSVFDGDYYFGGMEIKEYPRTMAFLGQDYLLVCDGQIHDGDYVIHVVNIEDPRNPYTANVILLGNERADSIAVYNDTVDGNVYLYAGGAGTFRIFNVTFENRTHLQFQLVSMMEGFGLVYDIAVDDDPLRPYVYLVECCTDGFQVVDVSDKHSPRCLIPPYVEGKSFQYRDEVVYLVGDDGLYILNVTNVSDISVLNVFTDCTFGFLSIHIDGDYGFASCKWEDRVYVMDISDLAHPVFKFNMSTGTGEGYISQSEMVYSHLNRLYISRGDMSVDAASSFEKFRIYEFGDLGFFGTPSIDELGNSWEIVIEHKLANNKINFTIYVCAEGEANQTETHIDYYYGEGCSVSVCFENYFGEDYCNVTTCGGIWNNDTSNKICGGNGVCEEFDKCTCFDEEKYTGDLCDVTWCFGNLSVPENASCGLFGECVDFDVCNCTSGFHTGVECEIPVCNGDQDLSTSCSGHGTCVFLTHLCDCDTGYHGAECSVTECNGFLSNDTHTGNVCSGHGDCVELEECECEKGYYDSDCSVLSVCNGVSGDKDEVCSGNGECVRISGESFICQCDDDTNVEFVGNGEEGDCESSISSGNSLEGWAISLISLGGLGLIFFCAFCFCLCFCCCFLLFLIGTAFFILCFGGGSFAFFFRVKGAGRRRMNTSSDDEYLMSERKVDEEQMAKLRINKSLFEIQLDEIKLIQILGSGGSSGTVFLANFKGTNVAFKGFKTSDVCSSQDYFDEFETEVAILSSISHPNILRFYGAILTSPRVGIVMEYCPNGDLNYFISKRELGESYPKRERIRMLNEVSLAMQFLHSRNIVHRDLKAENVLITIDERCKVMDFGCSKLVERMSQQKTMRLGTPQYMAPEIVTGEKDYSDKVDNYSMGILIYCVMTSDFHPYKDIMCPELKAANDATFRPKLTRGHVQNCEFLFDMATGLWDSDPDNRPSFEECCKQFRFWLEKNPERDCLEKRDDDGGDTE